MFDRPLSAGERLAQIETEQRRLARQLQDGYERGERVLYDGARLTGEPPSERQIPESRLALLAPQMLPEVQYAQLLIDVNRYVPFLAELGHYGQGARSPVRQSQLVTNALVVQALRLLPHEWIAIGKSPIASFAARHTGFRRRMLTWLLWITGEYGHFGGKVIPITEHESWHTLDPLAHLDSPSVKHATDAHGNTELTFAISDLLGWELYARFSDLTERRLHLLGDPDPHVPAGCCSPTARTGS